jgi:hypothetical protein
MELLEKCLFAKETEGFVEEGLKKNGRGGEI